MLVHNWREVLKRAWSVRLMASHAGTLAFHVKHVAPGRATQIGCAGLDHRFLNDATGRASRLQIIKCMAFAVFFVLRIVPDVGCVAH
ncbi:hypothetical protein ELH92_04725 [Rhizobium ruizarguesonis]|nr:hypothetical protein ELH92_04725 [Rhizobium ruizarguesonis]